VQQVDGDAFILDGIHRTSLDKSGTCLLARQAVQEFVTTQQGGRLAASIGGVLTGRGAHAIILDDPLEPDEAFSETQRRNACH
jgi:hypothetical protein